MVREAILRHEQFSGFDETRVECIVRHMERLALNDGQSHTFRNELLFVCSGALLVEQEAGVPLNLLKGDVLGELHVSQGDNKEDHHTVRAVSDTVVYSIRIETLCFLLKEEKVARRSMFLEIMKNLPLLSNLSPGNRKRLADTLCVRSYKTGSMLLQKDRPVEWVSFVLRGTVRRNVEDETGLMRSLDQTGGENGTTSCATFLEITAGGAVGIFELLFNLNSLTDAVAASMVLVAQMHTAYFENLIPRRSLEEMQCRVLLTPRISWLARYATEDVHRLVEQMERRKSFTTLKNHVWDKKGVMSSTAPSSTHGSTVANAGKKSTVRVKNLKMASSGEIVYSGKKNLYRFPLSVLEMSNTVIIAVVSDGVIIRWNAVAGRLTGFTHQDTLGQRIYGLLATETTRRGMREQLLQAQRFVGSWEDYVSTGLSSPCVYRFRQASDLYHVNLILSVVPSCLGGASDVMLLVGREAENPVMANHVEDGVRWMRDVLQPQLNAFQKRMKGIEEKNWNLSPEDGKKLLAHVETCNALMERYMRVSHLNLESLKETWKPVRIRHTLRQFAREMVQLVGGAENRLSLSFEDDVPSQEVFFDVEHMLDVLRRVVVDANQAGMDINISVAVSVVNPVLPVTPCSEITSPVIDSRKNSTGSHLALLSLSPPLSLSHNTPANSQSTNTSFSKDGVRRCGSSQRPQVIHVSSPSSLRRLRIVVTDTAELEIGGEEDAKLGLTTPPKLSSDEEEKRVSRRNATLRRATTIKACERIIVNMCGTLSFQTSRDTPVVSTTSIELPLLPAPWAEDEDEEDRTHSIIAGRPLSVVVADRNPKQRYIFCRLLWARRHAVVQVTSLHEAMMNVETGGTDVLVIDPLYLEATEEEYAALRDGTSPFDTLRQHPELVIVIYADDFNDWRVKKLKGYCHVIELPKPASGALLHIAMHEAERVVMGVREDEKQLALLRTAFTEFQPDRHKVGKLLGKGTFGEVFEVEDLLTGGKLAMKRVHLDGTLADDVVQELLAMTSLSHENFIHYFYCQKESNTQLCLYMELASGGTLRDKIRQQTSPMPLEEIVRYLQDLCRGLAYLHSKNYVHRDIKTTNALIDHHGRIKIGDFGAAKRLKRPSDKLFTVVGTPQFMAPEVINADATKGLGYNQKADIWSLGCVALELATGQAPFSYLESTRGMGIFLYISKLADTPDLSVIKDGNPFLYAFIKACLCIDPDKRPTAQELIHHDLMQETEPVSRNEQVARKVEIVEKLLHYAAIDSDGEEVEEEEEEEEEEGDLDGAGSSLTTCAVKGKGAGSQERPQMHLHNRKELKLFWNQGKVNQKYLAEEQDFFASTTPTSSGED
ncbi:protein kinase [Trypanosoma rangeli SC58]|uniref:non-specific serine/threonine protein kinase n=1 Tax=Trypanosoma rangeli SC58 TaxID=429131 RepID=A0A061JC89_TRYRA|nr:protein kinase [Trypanosoma rangeli SC58]